MARLAPLLAEQMSDAQKRIAEEIFATRGIGGGPFEVWLQSPELADRAQKLGAFTRYHTRLDKRQSELVILITARIWGAQFEWAVHEPEARKFGLSEDIIAAIKVGERPARMQPDETALYDFCHELYATKQVSDATYQAAMELLGAPGVVELVGILGYYALISMTLNVFQCDTPDGSLPLQVPT
jgi:4-carboxymuconolactone decarboxylase